jgi:hypothetical protein
MIPLLFSCFLREFTHAFRSLCGRRLRPVGRCGLDERSGFVQPRWLVLCSEVLQARLLQEGPLLQAEVLQAGLLQAQVLQAEMLQALQPLLQAEVLPAQVLQAGLLPEEVLQEGPLLRQAVQPRLQVEVLQVELLRTDLRFGRTVVRLRRPGRRSPGCPRRPGRS